MDLRVTLEGVLTSKGSLADLTCILPPVTMRIFMTLKLISLDTARVASTDKPSGVLALRTGVDSIHMIGLVVCAWRNLSVRLQSHHGKGYRGPDRHGQSLGGC